MAIWAEPDAWDRLAKHYGLFKDGELAAIFRVNSPVSSRLPISDHSPELEIRSTDIQIGRLLIAEEYRRTRACVDLLREMSALVRSHQGRVIATPLSHDEGGLATHTFERLNFRKLSVPYKSEDGRTLCPMSREPSTLVV